MRVSALLCLVLAAGHAVAQPASTPAPATPTPPKPTAVTGQSPKADSQPITDAKELLAALRAAMTKIESLKYSVTAESLGPMNRPGPLHQGTVTLGRGEGYWKIMAEGTVDLRNPTAKDAEPKPFKVSFDGVSARTVDDARKIVHELSSDNLEDLRAFFSTHMAATAVLWNLAQEPSFAAGDSGELTVEAEVEVGGQACDVLVITPKSKGGGGSAGNDEDSMPMRISIARADRLPRKVEVIRPARVKTAPVQVVRTIVLSEVAIDPAIDEGFFTIETPEGYTVKATKASGRKTAGKPAEPVKPGSELAASSPDVLRPGAVAPSFTLKDFAGEEHKLSDYKGKVVVLDFWGTWCPPCRAAMPAVQAVHEKFKDKDVVVLGLNYERSATADPEKFKKDNNYTYLSLAKADTIANKYKVPGWPTFYVIDKEGKIVWGDVGLPAGGAKGLEDAITGHVEAALAK